MSLFTKKNDGSVVQQNGYLGWFIPEGVWEIYKEPHTPVKYSVDLFLDDIPKPELELSSLKCTLIGGAAWSHEAYRNWKKYKITVEEVTE
jgi:hypothetical protein